MLDQRRRQFMPLVGGAAVAWSLAGKASTMLDIIIRVELARFSLRGLQ
jgi:hypothetical protein